MDPSTFTNQTEISQYIEMEDGKELLAINSILMVKCESCNKMCSIKAKILSKSDKIRLLLYLIAIRHTKRSYSPIAQRFMRILILINKTPF